MLVTVKCFAWAREVTGEDDIELEVPEEGTVKDLRASLTIKYPAFSAKMESIAVSVNQEFAGDSHAVSEGDELALIPPISGGLA
jgi:molybdopterin converting factor subunit 1